MIVLQGMCYSGKTTLGIILARELNIPFVDSRDLFQRVYKLSETEYLKKFGNDQFCKAERETLTQDFGDIVLSLGGSACYYDTEMKNIADKSLIIWLDVSFEEIEKRRLEEGGYRPIVYPEGIENFKRLYIQRRLLYEKYFTVRIEVNKTQPPVDTIHYIIKKIL